MPDEFPALGEFVGSIATIATLIYLAIQVRQNTARQRLDASVAIQQGQNVVVALFQDPVVARAYVRAGTYGNAAPIEERSRAINFVIQYVNHFEIVHDLYKDGTLDRETL